MIIFDNYINESKTEHNLKWPHIPDYPYRILITGGFRIWENKCVIKFNKQH